MVNEAFYAGNGPAHWQVFYDTLDRFPTTGPIPAPPQQAAVETALIKNVVGRRHGDAGSVAPALRTMQRDLETGAEEDVMVNIAPAAPATRPAEDSRCIAAHPAMDAARPARAARCW